MFQIINHSIEELSRRPEMFCNRIIRPVHKKEEPRGHEVC